MSKRKLKIVLVIFLIAISNVLCCTEDRATDPCESWNQGARVGG